jgi:hypothetical protein
LSIKILFRDLKNAQPLQAKNLTSTSLVTTQTLIIPRPVCLEWFVDLDNLFLGNLFLGNPLLRISLKKVIHLVKVAILPNSNFYEK